jgi:hypothetical protein
MLELPLLPGIIIMILITAGALLWGVVIGGRIGYNERLREEVHDTVAEMNRRTYEYRAARKMSSLTATFAYGASTPRRRGPKP